MTKSDLHPNQHPDHQERSALDVQTKCDLAGVMESLATLQRNWNVTPSLYLCGTFLNGLRLTVPRAQSAAWGQEGGGAGEEEGRGISGQALGNLVVGMSCL